MNGFYKIQNLAFKLFFTWSDQFDVRKSSRLRRYLPLLFIIGFTTVSCGRKATLIGNDRGGSPRPSAPDPRNPDNRNDPEPSGDRDNEPDEDRTHDPELGQPAPDGFFEANPCGGTPDFLCVIEPMSWRAPFLGGTTDLPFERNVESGKEVPITVSFTATAARFRLTSPVDGVERRHSIFFTYPVHIGIQLLSSTSPVMTVLRPDLSRRGFVKQDQDLAVGIAEHLEGDLCTYKAIFYKKDTQDPVAHISGTARCIK